MVAQPEVFLYQAEEVLAMEENEKPKAAVRFSNLPHIRDVNAEFVLDEDQKTAIQECLQKGTLKLKLQSAKISIIDDELLAGSYLWD